MTEMEERLLNMLEDALYNTSRAIHSLEAAHRHNQQAIATAESLSFQVEALKEENQQLRALSSQVMRTIFEN